MYDLSQFLLESEIGYNPQLVACYFLYKSTDNSEVKALKEQLDNERKKYVNKRDYKLLIYGALSITAMLHAYMYQDYYCQT